MNNENFQLLKIKQSNYVFLIILYFVLGVFYCLALVNMF